MRERVHGIVATTLVALFCLWAAPTLAQDTIPPPPVRDVVDENGVDVSRGTFNASRPGVSIGPAFPHGLSYSSSSSGTGWSNNAHALIFASGSTYTVTFGGESDSFTLSGGVFTPTEGNGSTLTQSGTTYTYTMRNGTVAIFESNGSHAWNANVARAETITFPDGTIVRYHHRLTSFCRGGLEGDPSEGIPYTCPGGFFDAIRLMSVTNNHGYQLKFWYASDLLDERNYANNYQHWSRPTVVRAINNAIDFCDPVPTGCAALTQTWPQLSLSYISASAGAYSGNVTDPAGQVTAYTHDANSRLTGIRMPGSTSDDVTVAYGTNGVSSVTRAGVAYTYAVSISGANRTTVVTNPNSGTRTYVTDTVTFRLKEFRNELNRLFTYGYDANGRLQTVTSPEGNYTQYTYDGRGNVTQTQMVPKGGSGAQIVTSATYPASCTNARTCNQPTTTTDARGQVTEYTYDATHGGVLTVTAPAATSGADRPQTRTSYETRQAYYKNSGGTIVASGTNVYLPTAVSTCSSGISPGCIGTANESRTTTNWGPQSAGTANNLLPVSSTQRDGTGTLAATTAATYDIIGNVLTVDGPLAGTADTTTARYDAGRRLIGMISPDPDGAGPQVRRAQRMNYATSGLMTSADIGLVNGITDSDWAAFNRVQTVTMTYDAYRRPVRRVLTAGVTDHAVVDLSYDTLGRPWCTATRMNPAAWGTLTAACTLQTVGGNGQDRIVRTSYDAASQVTQTEIAVGTSDQTTSSASTYTQNGRLETLTDANGNRTTYVYDNLDRLSQTQMPSLTTDGVSSGTDYEQLTYENWDSGTKTSGTVAARRLRDGTSIAFTYDNLGRMTLRNTPNVVWQDADISYAYDLLGRTSAITSPIGTNLAFGYDALGRQTSEASYYGTKTMEYDLAGRMTRLTWPDAFYVTYEHDATGSVTAIREYGSFGLGVYSYDSLGRRTGLTRGNGTTTTYAYDPVSRLQTLTNDLASAGSDLTLGFTYNPASQIATRTGPHGAYAWQGHYNVSRSYTPDGLNRYGSIATSGGATITPTYDTRGNLTSAGSATYTYTSENRMAVGNGTELLDDPAGRLMLIYTPAQQRLDMLGHTLITELDVSHVIQRRYVHGPGTDEPLVWYEGSGTADRRWLHADERGSIIAVSDGSGNAIGYNSYDAYGIPASGNIGRFQYTGQLWIPELGMYYYRARFYSPTLGRFMQTDPIGYSDGMNLYAYVGNDPVNAGDPSGTTRNCYVKKKDKDDRKNCSGSFPSVGIGTNIAGASCGSCMITSYAGPMASPGPSMRSGGTGSGGGSRPGSGSGGAQPSGARLVCTGCGEAWQEDPSTGAWVVTAPRYEWVYPASGFGQLASPGGWFVCGGVGQLGVSVNVCRGSNGDFYPSIGFGTEGVSPIDVTVGITDNLDGYLSGLSISGNGLPGGGYGLDLGGVTATGLQVGTPGAQVSFGINASSLYRSVTGEISRGISDYVFRGRCEMMASC